MSSAAAGLRLTLLLSNPGTFFAEISTLGISGPSLIHNAASDHIPLGGVVRLWDEYLLRADTRSNS